MKYILVSLFIIATLSCDDTIDDLCPRVPAVSCSNNIETEVEVIKGLVAHYDSFTTTIIVQESRTVAPESFYLTESLNCAVEIDSSDIVKLTELNMTSINWCQNQLYPVMVLPQDELFCLEQNDPLAARERYDNSRFLSVSRPLIINDRAILTIDTNCSFNVAIMQRQNDRWIVLCNTIIAVC